MADAKLSDSTFLPVTATGPERPLVAQGTTGKNLYRLDNWTAEVAPSKTDDGKAGYSIGSLWFNYVRGILYQAHSVVEGAAVWRRVRRGHMGYLVGNWYLGEAIGQTANSGSDCNVGVLRLTPFFVPEPISISDLAFRTGSAIPSGASAVAGNTSLAIYAGRAPGGRPSVRLGYTQPIAMSAVNSNYPGAIVGGNVPLEPGWHWSAAQADTVARYVVANASSNASLVSQIGSQNLNNVLNPSGMVTALEVSNTYNADPSALFPADLSAVALSDHTANRPPVVAFKVAAAA